MRVIAVTGRMGAGKSTVCRMLAQRGVATVDADTLVHALYREDLELRDALAQRFGVHILTADGVDRAALGSQIFSNHHALASLEALVHPRVHRREAEFLEASRSAGFQVAAIEAIKIVESGGTDLCDALWIVNGSDAVLLERLALRGIDAGHARQRLARQSSVSLWIDAFVTASDRLGRARPISIIDNGGSELGTADQVDGFLRALTPAT